jgi:hypothetical protein
VVIESLAILLLFQGRGHYRNALMVALVNLFVKFLPPIMASVKKCVIFKVVLRWLKALCPQEAP